MEAAWRGNTRPRESRRLNKPTREVLSHSWGGLKAPLLCWRGEGKKEPLRAARAELTRWPGRDDLQRETQSGQFALHSQSIQLVCQQFLANVETIKQLRLLLNNPEQR